MFISTHRIGKRGVMLGLLLAGLLLAGVARAQGTAFTYQGKLSDGGIAANGQYDFQFKLFDLASGGAQQGGTLTQSNVTVTNGVFTVQLDFSACASCFNGAARFLEVAVKPAGGASFTALSPRQPITANPYAIRSLNAAAADGLSVACVNCITSSQIASVSGGSVSGTIPVASVPAGSNNYIQNTTTQQLSSNFNISGDGTAAGTLSGNVVNAAAQYNIGGSRVLSAAGTSNVFAGIGAGQSNTTGLANAFFGRDAGFSNTTGHSNAFFGSGAGAANTTGFANTFFGAFAGRSNTVPGNSFFGASAGFSNTTGFGNSFFGNNAGISNTTAFRNAFFGAFAGEANRSGNDNAFFGCDAGKFNTTGSANTFFGSGAGISNTTASDNAFFGSSAGGTNTTGFGNAFFGAVAGFENTEGINNVFVGTAAGNFNTTGSFNVFIGTDAGHSNTEEGNNTFVGTSSDGAAGVNNATSIGANASVTQSNSLVLGSINGVNGASTDTSVGIGTTAPKAKLHVQGGAVYVGSPGQGIILKSPDGTVCRLLSIDNSGAMVLTPVTCP